MLTAFCHTVERDVLLDGDPADGCVVTCMDYGDGCAPPDAVCPLTGVPSLEMGRRFAVTRLGRRRLLRTQLRCARCREVTTKLVLAGTHLFCVECGTVTRCARAQIG
jgi:hypothetical protein